MSHILPPIEVLPNKLLLHPLKRLILLHPRQHIGLCLLEQRLPTLKLPEILDLLDVALLLLAIHDGKQLDVRDVLQLAHFHAGLVE